MAYADRTAVRDPFSRESNVRLAEAPGPGFQAGQHRIERPQFVVRERDLAFPGDEGDEEFFDAPSLGVDPVEHGAQAVVPVFQPVRVVGRQALVFEFEEHRATRSRTDSRQNRILVSPSLFKIEPRVEIEIALFPSPTDLEGCRGLLRMDDRRPIASRLGTKPVP